VSKWRVLATYDSTFEADFAMELLHAASIPARRVANDSVGVLGPGFQGVTAFTVTIHVPAALLAEAQAAVSAVGGP